MLLLLKKALNFWEHLMFLFVHTPLNIRVWFTFELIDVLKSRNWMDCRLSRCLMAQIHKGANRWPKLAVTSDYGSSYLWLQFQQKFIGLNWLKLLALFALQKNKKKPLCSRNFRLTFQLVCSHNKYYISTAKAIFFDDFSLLIQIDSISTLVIMKWLFKKIFLFFKKPN